MTLIECFTKAHIDNLAACLSLRPEKMILLGDSAETAPHIKRYRQILKERRQNTVIVPCHVDETDLRAIGQTVHGLLTGLDDCVIDLTGGDELVIMAVGAVIAALSREEREKIRVQKMDPGDCLVHDCVRPGQVYRCNSAELSVAELLQLNGGKLLYPDYRPPADARPGDLDGIWRVITRDPGGWNRAITYLTEFEKRDGFRSHIRLQVQTLRREISGFEEKYSLVRALLEQLDGPVIQSQCTDRVLEYRYNSPLMRYCTLKAGNTLELKTLLTGRTVLENGAPFFRDSQMGAVVDWDGVLHYPAGSVPETRNEIDVVLMRGTVPLFISCKNGEIGEAELYKLQTVASRFGGEQARKLLIATRLDENSRTNRSIMQRAWDMNIRLVPDAADMTDAEWRDTLKSAMR